MINLRSIFIFFLISSYTPYAFSESFIFLSPISFSPWVIIKNGEASGIIYNWAKIISTELQMDFKFDYNPFPRFLHRMEYDHDFDMTVMDNSHTIDTKEYIKITPPIYKYDLKLVYQQNLGCNKIQNIAALVSNKSDLLELIKSKCKYNGSLTNVNNIQQKTDLLIKNRIDAAVISDIEISAMPTDKKDLINKLPYIVLKHISSNLYVKKNSLLSSSIRLKKISIIVKKLKI
jgi:hypothetical protein